MLRLECEIREEPRENDNTAYYLRIPHCAANDTIWLFTAALSLLTECMKYNCIVYISHAALEKRKKKNPARRQPVATFTSALFFCFLRDRGMARRRF